NAAERERGGDRHARPHQAEQNASHMRHDADRSVCGKTRGELKSTSIDRIWRVEAGPSGPARPADLKVRPPPVCRMEAGPQPRFVAFASLTARRIASTRLLSSALPWRAISKAVP